MHLFLLPAFASVIWIGGGGVGLLLVQWAKHLGAYVIGTVSTEEKARIAREAGADDVILYAKEDFAKKTMRLTNGHGADIIFDGVGKATFKGDLDAVAVGGHIVVFGASSGPADPVPDDVLKAKFVTVSRGSLQNFIATREELLRRANDVIQGIREGWLKLRIDRILDLDEAVEAHRVLENRESSGKILLAPPEDVRRQAA